MYVCVCAVCLWLIGKCCMAGLFVGLFVFVCFCAFKVRMFVLCVIYCVMLYGVFCVCCIEFVSVCVCCCVCVFCL